MPVTTELFRPDAVAAAAGSQFGEPLQISWRGSILFTAAAALAVALLLHYGASVHYASTQRTPAYVDVRSGLVTVRAPAEGMVVARLHVQEGQHVASGALLATLNADRRRPEGGSRLIDQRRYTEEERSALVREGSAARDEVVVQLAQIDQRASGLRAEREILESQHQSASRVLASLEQQAAQASELADRGYFSRLQLAQRQDAVSTQRGHVEVALAAIARLQREISLLPGERKLALKALSRADDARRRQLGRIDSEAALAETDAEQGLLAPQEGVVSVAQVPSGQSLLAGQVLFKLKPVGQPLIVRAWVPSRAIANLATGATVKVAFQAYPQERFGLFDARVLTIGESPMLPHEQPALAQLAEPHYQVVAELVNPLRGPAGETLLLKAGMLGELRVMLEERSLLEWLFAPLLRTLGGESGPALAPAQR